MVLFAVPGVGAPDSRPSQAVAAPHPLVVADGREVRLISLGGTRTDALLARVALDIGGAVAAVEKFWGGDWPREIDIIATSSESQFISDTGLDPGGAWADIAAVAVSDSVDLDRHTATGQRIVFAPGAVAMGDEALRLVLTHELFHFAARADTALDAPRWLVEGTADFVARPPGPVPPAVATSGQLPTDGDLDMAGPARAVAYDRAWSFARFVADSYGIDGLRRLYADSCGPRHGDFAHAVEQALHIDLMDLRARWAQWLTR